MAWKKLKDQMGSNPGGLYQDEEGMKWYIKFLSNEDRMRNELLAYKLYELAGVHVPEAKLVQISGQLGIASKWNSSLAHSYDASELASGKDAFAVDAWLANWDVVGLDYDNMLLDKELGVVHRIDPGGSLDYRAQGQKKGPAFGDQVIEIESLRDADINETAHSVFNGMSKHEIRDSIDKVLSLPDASIRKIVLEIGPSNKQEILRKLLARKKHMKELRKKFASKLLQAKIKLSFVTKCPGHKNSKGELAEWCVKSHETDKIISSHRTEAEAKEHLRQMHIHKG